MITKFTEFLNESSEKHKLQKLEDLQKELEEVEDELDDDNGKHAKHLAEKAEKLRDEIKKMGGKIAKQRGHKFAKAHESSVLEAKKNQIEADDVQPGMRGVDYAGAEGKVRHVGRVADLYKHYKSAFNEDLDDLAEMGIEKDDIGVIVQLDDDHDLIFYGYGPDGFVCLNHQNKK